MDYLNYFKNKKITVMGLGLLGRGVNDIKFLTECGADLLVTDLKDKKELKNSLAQLKKYKNIKYVLGRHRLSDFRGRDMILKAAGVPLDSPFINEARKNNIPIEMDESLFAKLSDTTIVGVTGTKGKTTICHLIYKILKNAGKKVFLAGNIVGKATLPLIKKVKKSGIIVLELSSWQLQGFGEAKISPHIAIFANFIPDHLNYYESMDKYFYDKSHIYKYQTIGDYVLVDSELAPRITGAGKKIIIDSSDIGIWKTKVPGNYNLMNIAFVAKACEILGVSRNIIKSTIKDFKGVAGRLEFVRKFKGVRYYNDTTATIPESAIAALMSLNKNRNVILLAGGLNKNLSFNSLVNMISKTVKNLVLFKGTATDEILKLLPSRPKYPVTVVLNMKEAVKIAVANAKNGDIVLLSPGAASFGMFINEYDRGEQFVKLVKNLR